MLNSRNPIIFILIGVLSIVSNITDGQDKRIQYIYRNAPDPQGEISVIQQPRITEIYSFHINDSLSTFKTFLETAQKHIRQNNDSAIYYLDKAYDVIPNLKREQSIAEYLKEKGNYYYKKGMMTQSIECYRKSLQILMPVASSDLDIANLHYLTAYVFYDLSKSDSAILHLTQALTLYEAQNDTSKIILMLNDIGLNYMVQGRLKEAVNMFIRGIRLSESTRVSKYLGTLYMNIGLVNNENRNNDLALEYFNQSINEYKKIKEIHKTIYPLNAIGGVLLQQKKYKQAINCLFEALKIAQTNQDSTEIGFICRTIGEAYLAMGEMNNSERYLTKGLTFSRNSSPLEKAEVYLSLSKYYSDKKKFKLSIFYGNKAFQIGNKINALSPLRESALQLSHAFEKIGNLKYALKFRVKYEEIRDSLLSLEKSKYISQLQLDYDFEKNQQLVELENKKRELASREELQRQKIIRNYSIILFLMSFAFAFFQIKSIRKIKKGYALLEEQNNTINQQKLEIQNNFRKLEISQKELTEANAAKDKFFSIIAHDLRSPFNVILGYSDMLASDWDDLDDHTKHSIVKELHHSSQITFTLLENLLMWGQIQQKRIAILKENLNLTDLVNNSIAPYLPAAKQKNIQVKNEICADNTIFADKFTMGITISNLVNNAIKFTHKNGNISISSSPDTENYIKIYVSDTGVGIKPELIEKVFRIEENFSTSGTNKEKGTGLGLILCKEFAEKNNGSIEVHSIVNQGSQFILRIPGANITN